MIRARSISRKDRFPEILACLIRVGRLLVLGIDDLGESPELARLHSGNRLRASAKLIGERSGTEPPANRCMIIDARVIFSIDIRRVDTTAKIHEDIHSCRVARMEDTWQIQENRSSRRKQL
jgi:hypothetical protein